MKTQGVVHYYGDNVDTDVILPGRYLNLPSYEELAKHCMEDIDKNFASNVKPGDIMVAGWNFGCGSSREHAPIAIKTSGVACIIAKSFARIFYRNAINTGLAIIECPDACDKIKAKDIVSVDFSTGIINNLTTKETYKAQPFPEFIQQIIGNNGLLKFIKNNNCSY